MNSSSVFRHAVFTTFILLFLASSTFAQSTWTGAAGDNDWHNPANWNPNVVPTSAAVAIFDASGTYTVNFSSNGNAQQLRIEGGTVTLDGDGTIRTLNITSGGNFINGGNLTLKQMILQFNGGDINHRNGDLRLENGSQLNNTGVYNLGFNADSDVSVTGGSTVTTGQVRIFGGDITIDGPGSNWTSTNVFGVGRGSNRTANLNIENGGSVVSTRALVANENNSTGNVLIDGANSSWEVTGTSFVLANQGTGSVTVSNEGSLDFSNAAGIFEIGRSSPASNGTLTVQTFGTANIAGNLFVGVAGDGGLNVTSGGVVSNSLGIIGRSPLSIGEVTVGPGGEWINRSNLYLGGDATNDGGTGSLSITSSFGSVMVGNDPTLTGTSFAISSNVSGQGNLVVRNGSAINNSGGGVAIIGGISGFHGSATVAGTFSRWNNSSDLNVGFSGDGTLDVTGGGFVSNESGFIGRFSGSTGTVTVGAGSQWNNRNNLYLGGNTTNDGGTGTLNILSSGRVIVGNDPGALTGTQFTISSNVSGQGKLVVQNGSTINNVGSAYIGESSGFDGGVSVDGAGSQWANSDNLIVGVEGRGTLNVTGGGVVANSSGFIGGNSGSTGSVTVDGAGSQWNNFSDLLVGAEGTGTLNVTGGGVVSNRFGFIGDESGSTGTVTVDGAGSQWNNSLDLRVGNGGTGTLDVTGGGVVSSDFAIITDNSSSVTVDGAGSQWNNSSELVVGLAPNGGGAGAGTLTVTGGGVVSNTFGTIGLLFSTGSVTVDGVGSQWNSSSDLNVGFSGTGTLNVSGGGVVSNTAGTIGSRPGSTGSVTVDGAGSQWNNSSDLFVGSVGTGTLNVSGGGVVSNTVGTIGSQPGSTGSVTVYGAGSQWNNSSDLFVGGLGTGTLNVFGGGVVSNTVGSIGNNSGSTGSVSVDGAGSQWNNSSNLFVGGVGIVVGTGTLSVTGGGVVSNTSGSIGNISGSTGSVTVDGAGSQWNNSSNLFVGGLGTGTLNVSGGGVVSSSGGTIGFLSGSTGSVTVDGAGSQWNNSSVLTVGDAGTGTLNINNDGLVSVGGATSIGTNGTVSLGGGRFEFGSTDLTSFGRIGGTSGSLKGDVDVSGIHNVANLTAFQTSTFDISEVSVVNTGTLYGSGFLNSALNNQSRGELRTGGNDFVRFEGIGNANSGQINNIGGITEFANDMTNQAGGEINNFDGFVRFGSLNNEAGGEVNGRGQFIATDSWTNQGEMRFSNGTADILGDFDNQAGGVIITSGDGTTTFFDAVVHNGTEIRTSEGSNTVFFGDLSGAGAFTGLGDVLIEGAYNPGNSPDVIQFDGTLRLGSNSITEFEIGGFGYGEFDRLEIGGDFYINGLLNATLLDNYLLGFNEEFIFADVQGDLFGQFQNFGEGDLVGSFNGVNLFVTYGAGDGNDVAFFSTVPEPGTGIVLVGVTALMAFRRKRV